MKKKGVNSRFCKRSAGNLLKKMKLLIAFFFAGLLGVSASTYSQQTKLSLNLEKVTVKEAFRQIEKNTEFVFFYNEDYIDVNRNVNVKAIDENVEIILSELLKGTSNTFKIYDRQIVILPSEKIVSPTIIKVGTNTEQQKKEISGEVKDSKGLSIPGVSVVLKGTTIGTITNSDGQFRLSVAFDAKTLVFSFVGMKTQEIAITSKTLINVVMEEEAVGLEEVVAIGYGTQKKNSVTGAIASVKKEDLLKVPVSNTSNALAGRLPGLLSSQVSGEPGLDYASVNIRGFGNALIIVDGIESSMNNVSTYEIADITILKDASAAIYGSRAGNGVILITTKRGTTGKPIITLGSSFSWQQPTLYPNLLNAAEYTQFQYDSDVRGKIDPSKYRFPLSEVQKWKAAATPDYQSTNWWDYLMKKNAPFQQYNLSATGGSEKIKYFLGYNRSDQGGMLKSDAYHYSIDNFRSNIDAQITDAFSISGDLSAMISNINTPPREHSMIWSDITGVLPMYHAVLPDADKIPYTGNVTSVVASTSDKGGYMKKNFFQFAAKFSATYKIPGLDGLVAKGMMDYHRNTRENKYWMIGYDMWQYNWANSSYIKEGSAWQTRLNEGWQIENKITANAGLYYNKTFGDHTISAMALSEIVQSKGKNISGGTDGFLGNSIDYLFAGAASSARVSGGAWEGGRVGYIGRLNYSYKSKYIFEATVREDGSPVFAPDKRWGFFPSISAAWRASEESFFKNNLSNLNNLKLRVGVSKSGFDGIGNFQYLTGYGIMGSGVVDNKIVPGVGPTAIANPDITWEKITLYNAGLDYGVWKDKLYGSLDVFYRFRDDILAAPYLTVPTTFGAVLPQLNINSKSNRGFEFVIGHRNHIGDMKFDISANVSFSREKNEHVDEPVYTDPDQERIYKQSGQWTDLIWGLKTDGLFTSQKEIDDYPIRIDSRPEMGNSTVRVGDIKYLDQNGDNIIDWKDQVVIGRKASIQRVTPNDVNPGDDYVNITLPEIMYGLNMNASYKNFDFSALFQGGAGFSTWVWASDYMRYHYSWTEENNDPNALFPIQSSGPGPSVTGGANDYTLVNVYYLRLKTLNIGYTLPEKWLFGMKFRTYIAGTNVLTFSNLSKYKMDPEAPDGGNYYPQQKIYTIGLNLTF